MIVPEYAHAVGNPTANRAAGRIILAFESGAGVACALLLLFLDPFLTWLAKKVLPPNTLLSFGYLGGPSSFLIALLLSWSALVLLITAHLQQWLGMVQLRGRRWHSAVAGFIFPLLLWLPASIVPILEAAGLLDWLVDGWTFVLAVCLSIVAPIVWGLMVFRSPDHAPRWRMTQRR